MPYYQRKKKSILYNKKKSKPKSIPENFSPEKRHQNENKKNAPRILRSSPILDPEPLLIPPTYSDDKYEHLKSQYDQLLSLKQTRVELLFNKYKAEAETREKISGDLIEKLNESLRLCTNDLEREKKMIDTQFQILWILETMSGVRIEQTEKGFKVFHSVPGRPTPFEYFLIRHKETSHIQYSPITKNLHTSSQGVHFGHFNEDIMFPEIQLPFFFTTLCSVLSSSPLV